MRIQHTNHTLFYSCAVRKKASIVAFLLLCLLNPAVAAFAATPASARVAIDKMVRTMKSHPSLDVVFTVWQHNSSFTGNMSMSGKAFTLDTPDMKVWFDGKTQWSYPPSADEVNISEPTADEIAQVNPLSILSNLNSSFNFKIAREGKGRSYIQVIPKKASQDFASAVVTINTATNMPEKLEIKDAKGKITTVTVTSIKGGKKRPAVAYRFPKNKYPKVAIVDLR